MNLSELKLKKGHIGLGDFIAGANIGKLRDIVDKAITITEIQKGNVKDKKTNTTKEVFAFKCDASDDVYISNVIITEFLDELANDAEAFAEFQQTGLKCQIVLLTSKANNEYFNIEFVD